MGVGRLSTPTPTTTRKPLPRYTSARGIKHIIHSLTTRPYGIPSTHTHVHYIIYIYITTLRVFSSALIISSQHYNNNNNNNNNIIQYIGMTPYAVYSSHNIILEEFTINNNMMIFQIIFSILISTISFGTEGMLVCLYCICRYIYI